MNYADKVKEGDINTITGKVIETFESLAEAEKILVNSANLIVDEMRKIYELPSSFNYKTIWSTPGLDAVLNAVHERVDEEIELYFREQ